MTETTSLETTTAFLQMAYRAGDISSSRNYLDVFTDRLIRSLTEPTLADVMEHLLRAIHASGDKLHPPLAATMLRLAYSADAPRVLAWLRQQPRLAAMLAATRDEASVMETLAALTLPDVVTATGSAPTAPRFSITLTAQCLSPLAHGADGKAGNATLYRRMQVLTETGSVLTLPYYAGNAIRGQIRDLLAAHFLRTLDVKPALWFFYALYSGGALEEQSAALKAVIKRLGGNGALRTEGIRELRTQVPLLSLLGTALGNRILAGRCQVFDLRPRCQEWGTGEVPAAALMTWEYLTRREDREDHEEHHGMIAETECLKPGSVLHGGVEIDHGATTIERSALGLGLHLLSERAMLGAENRRGLGHVAITVTNAPDPSPYVDWLSAEADSIRAYLHAIEAVVDG